MKLDGAGQAKVATLEEALVHAQRLHGLVERIAMDAKALKDITPLLGQVRRATAPLVSLLKGPFSAIGDHVTGMLLIATRPGGAPMKVRALREAVALLRMQLDIAVTRTLDKHTISDGEAR